MSAVVIFAWWWYFVLMVAPGFKDKKSRVFHERGIEVEALVIDRKHQGWWADPTSWGGWTARVTYSARDGQPHQVDVWCGKDSPPDNLTIIYDPEEPSRAALKAEVENYMKRSVNWPLAIVVLVVGVVLLIAQIGEPINF